MIHIICALNCEADPILARYRMKKDSGSGLYRTYSNQKAGITLTISGTGKINAASATGYTHGYYQTTESDAWLNIAIAGHRSLDIGEVILAHQVLDVETRIAWYPQVVFPTSCRGMALKTLEQPSTEYEEYVFDMEAAGYLAIASRISSCELVHVLKIISDNKSEPAVNKPDKAATRMLIESRIEVIDNTIDSIQQLSHELVTINTISPEYFACLERWHLTWSERRILHNQLLRWQVLYPGISILKHFRNIIHTPQFLQSLEEHLNKAPIRY